jgi:hypothetical protein
MWGVWVELPTRVVGEQREAWVGMADALECLESGIRQHRA